MDDIGEGRSAQLCAALRGVDAATEETRQTMCALLLLDEDAIPRVLQCVVDLVRAQLAAYLLALLRQLVLCLERLLEDKGGLRTSGFLA